MLRLYFSWVHGKGQATGSKPSPGQLNDLRQCVGPDGVITDFGQRGLARWQRGSLGEGTMRRRYLEFMSMGLLLAPIFPLGAQNSPLKLVQTIPMSNVQGRLDHFGVDVKSKDRKSVV